MQVSVDKLLADTHEVDSLLARLLIGNGAIELQELGGDYRLHTPERDISQKLNASARFTPLARVTQGPDARIKLTLGGEDFSVRGEGQLNLDGPSDNVVTVQIDAPDLQNPGRWLNKDLSELQPFSLGATKSLHFLRIVP